MSLLHDRPCISRGRSFAVSSGHWAPRKNRRAFARRAFDLQGPSEIRGAHVHAAQTDPLALISSYQGRFKFETGPVILYDQRDAVFALLKQHADITGFGMFEDVVQSFLDDPVQIRLKIGAKPAVLCRRSVKFGGYAVGVRPFADKAAQSVLKA